MNLQKMMKQAQEVQSKITQLQAKLEEEESEGTSGSGMVKITLSGKGLMRRILIDAKLFDPSEKDMLEDLIVAAHNDAKGKIETRMAEEMGKLSGGLGLPPGFKLPF